LIEEDRMRTAIVIGISHYNDPGLLPTLPGCLNDVDDMVAYLTRVIGAPLDPANILRDGQATKRAIVDALERGIAALGSGDELIVHFSGHGAPFPLRNAVHDALCPFDFDWGPNLAILDTDIATLLARIPKDARMSIVADSCFSGGLTPDFNFLQALARARPHAIRTIPVPQDIAAEIATLRGAADMTLGGVATAAPNVVLLAACGAKLTAADAVFSQRPNGAMTFNLLKVLGRATPPATAEAIVPPLKLGLRRFSQIPELHGREALKAAPFLVP
jgi:hypothetical protein